MTDQTIYLTKSISSAFCLKPPRSCLLVLEIKSQSPTVTYKSHLDRTPGHVSLPSLHTCPCSWQSLVCSHLRPFALPVPSVWNDIYTVLLAAPSQLPNINSLGVLFFFLVSTFICGVCHSVTPPIIIPLCTQNIFYFVTVLITCLLLYPSLPTAR